MPSLGLSLPLAFWLWLSPTSDDMILYIENLKDSTRKLLELINEYSKVAGYKINTEKYLAFLYTNNEKKEREIKETVPFTIAMERIKYLGINLPKETNLACCNSWGRKESDMTDRLHFISLHFIQIVKLFVLVL